MTFQGGMMTVNDSDSGRRPRRALFPSMALAIELWLGAVDLDDPEEIPETERSTGMART